MKEHKSNYQDFIKIVAMVMMVVDHVGLFYFPEISIMRVLGRSVMPIFCFFAGYNFKDFARLRIFIWGVGAYVITSLFLYGGYYETNILVPIFLGQVFLMLAKSRLGNFWFAYGSAIFFGITWIWTKDLLDYGTLVITIMIVGYLAKQNKELKLPLTIAAALYSLTHTLITFESFALMYQILSVLVTISVIILFNARDFTAKIDWNLRALSRRSLEFYAIHLLLIQLIWRYYVIV